MHILQGISLRNYSTMRLGGRAAFIVDIRERQEVPEALEWARLHHKQVVMIGQGSNIVWHDDGFPGLVMVNKIKGIAEIDEGDRGYILAVGSGENWDNIVEFSVKKGLSGIEALSLIPGTAGATPVQNVGAYGQEISDCIVSVPVYDRVLNQFINIPAAGCAFDYRSSRFKTIDYGRFFIIGIILRLKRTNPKPPFYNSLQTYLDEHGINEYTPQSIREAVIAIRSQKLPDPKIVPNSGSFFANPIVEGRQFTGLHIDYPDMPYWPASGGRIKLSAAWLVEKAGYKGVHDWETGIATWKDQALIFVNEHANSTDQLLHFKQKVVNQVQIMFGIILEQEPELLP